MKVKSKKASKINNIEAISRTINKNRSPALKKVKCFKERCREIIEVKYVVPNKSYSKINN